MKSVSDFFSSREILVKPLRLFEGEGVEISVLRDDLLHPGISGNKWRKLKHNLIQVENQGFQHLLTFGGAFSNHLAAVAAAGKLFGFQTTGFVRGEPSKILNPTLAFCQSQGMNLKFLTRAEYREIENPGFMDSLRSDFPDAFLIPEGGTNCLALEGFADLVEDIHAAKNQLPDFICVASGTGGTAAGISAHLDFPATVLSFPVLKGGFMEGNIRDLHQNCCGKQFQNWKIIDDFHFAGYAKWNQELLEFITNFYKEFGFALDPVYTGKMFFGVFDLIKKGFFKPGSRVLLVHTGGLQGIPGFNERFSKNLPF